MTESNDSPPQEGAAHLLVAALDRAPSDREAFLIEACGGELSLLAEVRALLAAHEAMPGQFLDEPAADDARDLDSALADTMPVEQRERPATSKPSASNYAPELPLPEDLQALMPPGSYIIESFLGQGGMGAVFRGLQMPLRRPVAIKILAKRQAGEEDDFAFEERFKREAYAMASLTHPHIVQVYDCGDAGEHHLFISMELVEGGDLSDAIRQGRLTPERALKLIPQICEGMQAAHEHGLVHRDIKPANIFLTKDGRAKVADFGLAKRFDGHNTFVTKAGMGMGTPDYAAPEQFEAEPDIDHRADIYALGVMMYQMLTGLLPRGSNLIMPSQIVGVDPRIDDVVAKAMANDRDHRYQSTAEIAEDLAAIAGMTPATKTRPVPTPTRAVPSMPAPSMPLTSKSVSNMPVPRAARALTRAPATAGHSVAEPLPQYVDEPPPQKKSGAGGIIALVVTLAVLAAGAWFKLKPKQGNSPLSPSPDLRVSASSPWQPLFTDAEWKQTTSENREFVDGRLHLRGLPVLKPQPTADLAIRVRLQIQQGSSSVGFLARLTAQGGSYKAGLNSNRYIVLSYVRPGATGGDTGQRLGLHTLPNTLQPGDTLLLELRLQGDRLTVLVNDSVAIEARDSRCPGPGQWGIIAGDGWFESAEVQPALPAASPQSAPVEIVLGPWQPLFTDAEWNKTSSKREVVDRRLHLREASALKPQPATDGAIRARIQLTETTKDASVVARQTPDNNKYKLHVNPKSVGLLYFPPASLGEKEETLGASPLPAGVGPGHTLLLELRLQGDRLIGLVDGAVVIDVRDARVRGPGMWGINGNDGWYESVEVQSPLPAAPPAQAAGPAIIATMDAPFINSLGMKFVPVPITGGPAAGKTVLFSVWHTRVQDYEIFARETRREWPKPDFEQGPTHPAVNVNWDDAQAFCAWLTDRERKSRSGGISANERYRLPSDHEWSCAVGIGDQEDATKLPNEKSGKVPDVYPWDGAWPPPVGAGNYAGEEIRAEVKEGDKYLKGFLAGYTDGYARTAPAGSFAANRLGLFDLGGNAWSWCEEWYSGQQKERVLRGASWCDASQENFPSSRRGLVDPTRRDLNKGFRCVLEVPAPPLAAPPAEVAKETPYANTLGMQFLPVPIVGGPTAGKAVLFSKWDTRVQDYEVFATQTKRGWPKPDFEQGPTHPAVNVSWDDAQAFCAWLTARERSAGSLGENDVVRLPSDHEWSCAVGIGEQEDAARLPAEKNERIKDLFPWGGEWPPPKGAGNFAGEEFQAALEAGGFTYARAVLAGYNDGMVNTSPVGSFTANRFGLHDLSGNVWQWCEDGMTAAQNTRALRGGCWASSTRENLPSSRRHQVLPFSSTPYIGFRCVVALFAAPTAAANVSPASAPAIKTKDAPIKITPGMQSVPVPSGAWQPVMKPGAALIPGVEALADGWYRAPSNVGVADRAHDMGIRGRLRLAGKPNVWPFLVRDNQANGLSHYALYINKDILNLHLRDLIRGQGATKDDRLLKSVRLPRVLEPDDEFDLEVTTRGDLITVAFDGKLLIEVHDTFCKGERIRFTGDGKNLEWRDLTGVPASSLEPTGAMKGAPFINTLGMKFVPVPIGGGPTAGKPVLFSVWITRVQDYAAYAAANPKADGSWRTRQKDGVPIGREADHPVVAVSWEDAQAFCRWLTEKEIAEGKILRATRYRLPSDEEWSWAVGLPQEAGSTPYEKSRNGGADFPWGKEWPPARKVGNYADDNFHAKWQTHPNDLKQWMQGYDDGFPTTSPVGRFPANERGLHDMGGNVWQWCEDLLVSGNTIRVLRGASWSDGDRNVTRSCGRKGVAPSGRDLYYGFRCVLDGSRSAPTGP